MKTHTSWLWPDHAIRKRESRQLREDHNHVVNEYTDLARMLQRLAEKVRRANAIQHSGGEIAPEDWAELDQLTNEAFGLLD